jgi:hypothetical protein
MPRWRWAYYPADPDGAHAIPITTPITHRHADYVHAACYGTVLSTSQSYIEDQRLRAAPPGYRRCARCVEALRQGIDPLAYQWVSFESEGSRYAHAIPGDAVLGTETMVETLCGSALGLSVTVYEPSERVRPDTERVRCPRCASLVLSAAGLR